MYFLKKSCFSPGKYTSFAHSTVYTHNKPIDLSLQKPSFPCGNLVQVIGCSSGDLAHEELFSCTAPQSNGLKFASVLGGLLA